MTFKATPAPALEHDAMMLRRFQAKVGQNGRIERAIVWNLCKHLEAAGFMPSEVDDTDDLTAVADAKAAMELIFDLDLAHLYFKAKDGGEHRVMLVMGNGTDIVSDWTYATSDEDGFNAAMEAFDAEAVIAQLLGA